MKNQSTTKYLVLLSIVTWMNFAVSTHAQIVIRSPLQSWSQLSELKGSKHDHGFYAIETLSPGDTALMAKDSNAAQSNSEKVSDEGSAKLRSGPVVLYGEILEKIDIPASLEITNPIRLHHRADVVIPGNALMVCPSGNILESLQGRVAGMQVRRAGQYRFTTTIRGQGPPLYLLDGIPIDESAIIFINQFDISHIEILKSIEASGIYGGRGSNGVVAFYTRRGGE
jgi:hypothetical protein